MVLWKILHTNLIAILQVREPRKRHQQQIQRLQVLWVPPAGNPAQHGVTQLQREWRLNQGA